MNNWNYRLMAHESDNDFHIEIHEVYYDEKDKPISYTEKGRSVIGDDLESIKWTLDKMKESLNKPILYYGDKFPNEY